MADTQSQHHRALDLLQQQWSRRGQSPRPAAADWLDGEWGEVLAAAEQASRSGSAHVPLATLLAAARELASQAAADQAA